MTTLKKLEKRSSSQVETPKYRLKVKKKKKKIQVHEGQHNEKSFNEVGNNNNLIIIYR